MSSTVTSCRSTATQAAPDAWPGYQPDLGLMCTVADLLIPLFASASIGVKFAQAVARSALDEYRPETGADYVNVARTLAFSISALTLLGHAAAQDIAMAEKIRVFVRANALNRSADQSERTMMQRRRYQSALAEQPPSTPQVSKPPDALSAAEKAEVEAAVAKAVAACHSTFAEPQPEAALHRTAPALSAVPSSVPGSSIHYPGARLDNPPPQAPERPRNAAVPLSTAKIPQGNNLATANTHL